MMEGEGTQLMTSLPRCFGEQQHSHVRTAIIVNSLDTAVQTQHLLPRPPAVTAAEAPDGRDFADLWEASAARKAGDAAIEAAVEKGAAGPAPAAPGTAPGTKPTEYATPRTTQV